MALTFNFPAGSSIPGMSPAAGLPGIGGQNKSSSFGGSSLFPNQNPLGVTAKSPEQNIQQPSNQLPKSQVATPTPQTPNPPQYINGVAGSQFAPDAAARARANAAAATTPSTSTPYMVPPTQPSSYTVPSVLSTLFGAAGQIPGIQNVTQQEQKLLGDLSSQSGLPTDIYQGRAGQIQQQANTAVQNLLTARGQTLGAYESGLGAVAPITGVPYGTQTILPGQTGTATGSSGVSPSDPFYSSMQTYAQMLLNGQGSQIPSSITSNSALQAQLTQMAQSQDPNFNWNQALATGASQQSQTQQVQQYQSAAKQAQNLGLQLNDLMKSAGINPSDINAVNKGIQALASNTSDPNYQTFQNLINDLASTYAQVLTPAGGTTTDMVRSISQSLLNSSMSGQGISQVMQNLDAQVQAKISGVTTAYGDKTTTSSTQTKTSGTGGKVTAGGYSFIQNAQGQWIPA